MDYKKYAKVIFSAFKEQQKDDFESFLNKFFLLIKSKKQEKFLIKIYQEIENLIKQEEKDNITTLVVKDSKDAEKYKKELEKFEKYFQTENIRIKENKNIVGGFLVKNKKYILDNTYKTKLLKLYNNFIS